MDMELYEIYRKARFWISLFFKSSIVGILLLILATQLLSWLDLIDLVEVRAAINLIPDGFESSAILAMIIGIASAYILNFFLVKLKD